MLLEPLEAYDCALGKAREDGDQLLGQQDPLALVARLVRDLVDRARGFAEVEVCGHSAGLLEPKVDAIDVRGCVHFLQQVLEHTVQPRPTVLVLQGDPRQEALLGKRRRAAGQVDAEVHHLELLQDPLLGGLDAGEEQLRELESPADVLQPVLRRHLDFSIFLFHVIMVLSDDVSELPNACIPVHHAIVVIIPLLSVRVIVQEALDLVLRLLKEAGPLLL
mmetsp:Transcript_31832/g.90906  ORF Transcript_31832/g.90906 Transcript_31832/m.90906 type:complete len:220 (-) Transcript_31832:615-1274(-)